MTDTPFLDHRAIKKLADQTPKLAAILAQREIFDHIDPITAAIVDELTPVEKKGYMATSDGRIIWRLVGEQEAREIFGVGAATTAEAFLAAERVSRIGEIEQAGMAAQARAVKLLAAAEKMFETISTGRELGNKDRIRIGALLHSIKQEDEANADRISQMKAENEQANRDRKWCMRKLGIVA